MADSDVEKSSRTRCYLNFVFECKNDVVDFCIRQKERTLNAFEKVYEFLSPVVHFFAFFYGLFVGVISAVKRGFAAVDSTVHHIVHFEYKQFFLSVSQTPQEYFSKGKTKLYQVICFPIKRRVIKVKRKIRKRFLDARVYFRGFRELCRRLFLLASDFTPGGQLTVLLVLLVTVFFLVIQIYRYSRLFFQLFELLLSAFMFVIRPVIWTVQDLLKVALVGVDLVLSLLKYICYLLWLCVQGAIDFVIRVLAAFLSGIYQCLVWFMNLKLVKLTWLFFLKLAIIGLEFFIFKVVPFLAVIFAYFFDLATIISSYFYDYFVDVYDGKAHDAYWSNTRVFAAVLTSLSFLIAYRYRNRFSIAVHLDKDSSSSLSRRLRKRLRGANSTEEFNAANFKVSSSAHICLGFLREECNEGRRCSDHHCPWPYHWQYRVPVQGWQSFNQHDVDVIEKLFCDPVNEIAKTRDINPDLSAVTRRSHVKTNNSIRLDFQHMRMEVGYQRLELRRLSTESSAKSSDELATKWLWYQLNDEGTWVQYGSQGKPKEQDIEVSFLSRESSYNYKVQGQEYRIYFFMTPMYERNMNPREYKRRFVRRRPLYRSLEDF